MNALLIFALGLFILILQTTIFGKIGFPSAKAPLVISAVIYAAFHLEKVRGLVLSFFLGYGMDVFSGSAQGITPIAMVLLCLLGQQMRKGIVVEGAFAMSIVAFIYGVLYGLLWFEMKAIIDGRLVPSEFPVFPLLQQALILAIASPFLVEAAAVLDRMASKRRRILWKR